MPINLSTTPLYSSRHVDSHRLLRDQSVEHSVCTRAGSTTRGMSALLTAPNARFHVFNCWQSAERMWFREIVEIQSIQRLHCSSKRFGCMPAVAQDAIEGDAICRSPVTEPTHAPRPTVQRSPQILMVSQRAVAVRGCYALTVGCCTEWQISTMSWG